MASPPSPVACDDVQEEVETKSVFQCVVCNQTWDSRTPATIKWHHVIEHVLVWKKKSTTQVNT